MTTPDLDFLEFRDAVHRSVDTVAASSGTYFDGVYDVEELRYVVNEYIRRNIAYKPRGKWKGSR